MSPGSDNTRLREIIAAAEQRWAGSKPPTKSWLLGYAAHHFVYREARYDRVADEATFVRDRRGKRYGPALVEARRVWGEVDEAEFVAGWGAKPGRVDKIAKAIHTLLTTTNSPKGDNTVRSRRRRAWRDLDEFK
jgi:hypothetical protein